MAPPDSRDSTSFEADQARTAAGARTLPGEYYTAAEIYRTERERIFSRAWTYVGHVSQVAEAGDFFAARVDGESLLVTRARDGRIRAFYNVCRHRGSRLCTEDSGRFGGGIQCPYHAWTYELDGRLRAAPTMDEVAGFDRAEWPLRQAALESLDGFLFVSLATAPEPFSEVFAPLAGKFAAWRVPELASAHRTEYRVEANWKLLFQNYSECYHCPNVHPILNRLTPYRDSTNDLEEGPFLGGPMRLAAGAGASMTMNGRACAAPLGGVAGPDLELVYYYTVFPNLFVSLHPDYVLVHRSEPEGPSSTRIVCDWYFHPEAVETEGFDPSGAVEFWDMTNRQDWELCRISQEGIASRAYSPGPYSELESQLAAFDRHYLERLGRGAGSGGLEPASGPSE